MSPRRRKLKREAPPPRDDDESSSNSSPPQTRARKARKRNPELVAPVSGAEMLDSPFDLSDNDFGVDFSRARSTKEKKPKIPRRGLNTRSHSKFPLDDDDDDDDDDVDLFSLSVSSGARAHRENAMTDGLAAAGRVGGSSSKPGSGKKKSVSTQLLPIAPSSEAFLAPGGFQIFRPDPRWLDDKQIIDLSVDGDDEGIGEGEVSFVSYFVLDYFLGIVIFFRRYVFSLPPCSR